MQVTLDLSDDPGQVLVGGCQRPNEFVFLDRLYPIAEIEIAIGEETGNDDVAGIDLERLGERLDGSPMPKGRWHDGSGRREGPAPLHRSD